MGGKDEVSEDRYVGNRLFRQLSDGQVVEVNPDGTYEREYSVGGREFDAISADFESLSAAREHYKASLERQEASEPAPTQEDKITGYLKMDKATCKQQPTSGRVSFSGSVRALLNDAPKGTEIAGSHHMEATHQIATTNPWVSLRRDLLKEALEKQKIRSYRSHVEKAYGLGSSKEGLSRALGRVKTRPRFR